MLAYATTEDRAVLTFNRGDFSALHKGSSTHGMTIDSGGNVYLTGNGVTVFDKTGKKLITIPIPEAWTGNVTFAGKDHDLLFITASKRVYGVKMRVKGV